MRDSKTSRKQGGFTLIELVVVLTVIGVLAVVAVPGLRSMVVANRLTAQSNELLAALQSARMESMRRNVRVIVCRSADGTSCSSGTTWPGYIVFVDRNRNDTLDTGEILRVGTVEDSQIQLVESSNVTGDNFAFRPDGMAREGTSLLNARLRFCATVRRPTQNVRDVVILSGSRFAVEPGSDNNTCSTTVPNPTP